jgi:branched-chain amino acid transport system ATP-binding protein
MARTFQIVKPFENMTVRENVMIGSMFVDEDREAARTSADELLETFGLTDVAEEMPSSITIENKKRMELARAMATEPSLLLVDELMAGLDEGELDAIIGHLERINAEGCSVLLIEHIIKVVVEVSDRVVVLNNGEFIADDVPEEIMNKDEVIETYLGEGAEN